MPVTQGTGLQHEFLQGPNLKLLQAGLLGFVLAHPWLEMLLS